MGNNFHEEYRGSMDEGSFYLPFGIQSSTTNPSTPNQLNELGMRLNEGVKNVEVGALSEDVFESIPSEHFREMGRLARLTDTKVSMHAPMVDLAGFSKEGKWSEDNREDTERYMKSVLDRVHKIDPKGNVLLNMHSTGGVPGFSWKKGVPSEKDMVVAVEKESGNLIPLRYEKLQYIEGEKIFTPEDRLEVLNESKWQEEKLKLMSYEKAKDEINVMKLNIESNPQYRKVLYLKEQNLPVPEEDVEQFNYMHERIMTHENHMNEYDNHIMLGLQNLNHLYSNYYDPKSGSEKRIAKRNKKMLENVGDKYRMQFDIEKRGRERINKAMSNASPTDYDKLVKIHNEESQRIDKELQDKVGQKIDSGYLMKRISSLPAPQLYDTAENFAKEKTTETLSNLAMHSYGKYGHNSPIIAVENWVPESVLSRADSMKELIKDSRSEFSSKLMKDKGMSSSEANKVAEKLIGATWDVGHIFQLRKSGYTKKDVIEETEKIAPYVKHVHLTDHFGYTDSHLAPGMGEVPIKEMVEKLKKEDIDRVYVNESGGFINNFNQNPVPHTLESLNSPLYSMNNGPSWAQARDFYSSYTLGYQDLLTGQKYSGGFSGLPLELGADRKEGE